MSSTLKVEFVLDVAMIEHLCHFTPWKQAKPWIPNMVKQVWCIASWLFKDCIKVTRFEAQWDLPQCYKAAE